MRPGAVRHQSGAGAPRPLVPVPTIFLVIVLLPLLLVVAPGCDVPATGGLGQVVGSGKPVTKQYDDAGFTRVSVDSGFDVTVTRGGAFAVSVTADDNVVEHLRVSVEGDTLHIGLEPNRAYRDTTLTATVTMPSLAGLEASGASKAAASGFASGDPLGLQVSGASRLALKGVRAGEVTVEVSGAGDLTGGLEAEALGGDVSGTGTVSLQGAAAKLQIGASGAGNLELGGMTAQDADLELSGGADAVVRVTGTLDVSASGGATLVYSGSPTLGRMEVSGGAEVKPAGS